MLEGNELEGNIGSIGKYEVDLDPSGKLKVSVGVEIDIIAELEKAAAKTGTQWDDNAIAWVKKALGK